MSDSVTAQEAEVQNISPDNGSSENSFSSFPSAPNFSPNLSLTNETESKLLQLEQGQEELRAEIKAPYFEAESNSNSLLLPSEMPSYLVKPTQSNDLESSEEQRLEKDLPLLRFQSEEQIEKTNSCNHDFNESATLHPDRQVEREVQWNQFTLLQDPINPEAETTSNLRQRVTPMPTDPEEDTRDLELVRLFQLNTPIFKFILCKKKLKNTNFENFNLNSDLFQLRRYHPITP